ncbi:hypothetical protein HDU76_013677, partial [Blyttiomyces sp. JEL0837]
MNEKSVRVSSIAISEGQSVMRSLYLASSLFSRTLKKIIVIACIGCYLFYFTFPRNWQRAIRKHGDSDQKH